jgi:hypothetical protein
VKNRPTLYSLDFDVPQLSPATQNHSKAKEKQNSSHSTKSCGEWFSEGSVAFEPSQYRVCLDMDS